MAVIVQVQARLAALRQEYQVGEEQLRDLARRELALRETMLRIAGAIQVLEEVLSTAQEGRPAPAPGAPDATAAAPGATAAPAAAAPDAAADAAGPGRRGAGRPEVLTVP
jgi:hypothetical protein